MKRVAYFDNAKLILIFLVVFGHLIQPFVDSAREINTLYLWIYTFHMPAFIFLAGYFAKGEKSLHSIIRLAKKLLIPYIIFQLLYTGYYYLIDKSAWQSDIFYPQWSLWFLLSLFSWHILLIWFKKLTPFWGLVFATCIGLSIGYIGDVGHAYSLSRTFVFFPFFLLGHHFTEKHLQFLTSKISKGVALCIMVAMAIMIYFLPEIDIGWLLASKSYVDLEMPNYGLFMRLTVYMISTFMMLSMLAWVPNQTFKFTYLGTRTLYVYLLHGFFIQYFRTINAFKIDHMIDLFGLVGISVALIFILSSKPVVKMWKPVIEGRLSLIYSR